MLQNHREEAVQALASNEVLVHDDAGEKPQAAEEFHGTGADDRKVPLASNHQGALTGHTGRGAAHGGASGKGVGDGVTHRGVEECAGDP